MARTYKTRHQLFLPEDMSKRLAHIAQSFGEAANPPSSRRFGGAIPAHYLLI
jgi:hypothetical protein